MARLYRPLPSAELLWELFEYQPLTGELFWRRTTSNRVRVGTATGSTHVQGYAATRLKGISYLTHRLIWVWLHSYDPKNLQVDHADGNRINNTYWNLRLATSSQNAFNSKTRRHNKIGVKGVRQTLNGRFSARIRKDGVTYSLGTFDTIKEAAAAYEKAAIRLHGDFFRVE